MAPFSYLLPVPSLLQRGDQRHGKGVPVPLTFPQEHPTFISSESASHLGAAPSRSWSDTGYFSRDKNAYLQIDMCMNGSSILFIKPNWNQPQDPLAGE